MSIEKNFGQQPRQIYYQHQELFETQRVVDELVDDLAYTLGTDRDDLNIVRRMKYYVQRTN